MKDRPSLKDFAIDYFSEMSQFDDESIKLIIDHLDAGLNFKIHFIGTERTKPNVFHEAMKKQESDLTQ